MSLLKVSAISKQQDGAFILKDISFEQQRFQHIAIAGETGSGKSTLLKMISGLAQPDSGQVFFEEQKVKGPLQVLIPGHPGVAYLSQYFELRHNYRVDEILSYANMLTDEEAQNIYRICQIDHLLQRRTDQLSGGEKQRIALARLLTTAPRLLLLDEPYSNLDMIHKQTLKTVINDIGEKLEITCMLVSHDPQDILSWADTVFLMRNGEIIQQGAPEEVYNHPVNEYAAGLLGKYNLIPSAGDGKSLFIRPEHFIINGNTPGAFSGQVQSVSFWGGYYDIEIQPAKKNKITVRQLSTSLKKGDTVNVAVLPEHIWYL
ncbi:ABC transporter ATP-binding protein [uncultured Chitinophaga sp.]|jgi:ABC-type spermidine/putrescine transport systems, ATPase components|uniref:ABC transporter ATP-binding protein n=1 Tax=uncultured Chitinophaga sp. TaxID=339340 RepID=UPI00263A0A8F|nr:ABC transporter ATP-binding protein [uncultured Chitinophaga sp.]